MLARFLFPETAKTMPKPPPPLPFKAREISSFFFADSRKAALKRVHREYVMREDFVRKLPHHGRDAGSGLEWGSMATEGIPAFIVNPKFGTCLIWARKTVTRESTGYPMIFYLVTLVRPVMAPKAALCRPVAHQGDDDELESAPVASLIGEERRSSGSDGRRRKKNKKPPVPVVAGDYYEVPATVMLPSGMVVDYIVPLNFMILKVITPDVGGEGVILLEIKAREGIHVITMKEFNETMNADDEKSQGFREAYSAFHATDPLMVARLIPSAKRTVSDEAKMYMLSTNFASIGARYQDRPKRHLFHP